MSGSLYKVVGLSDDLDFDLLLNCKKIMEGAMVLKKVSMCTIMIVAMGLMLCLSSCSRIDKADSGGAYHGKRYLENMGNGVCRQHPEGLMWQAGRSQKFSSWDDANRYVKSLELGGFDDWRLPTPDECLKLSQLLETKKGDCPMETGGNHWVQKSMNIEAGQWESNVYCDGPLYRWTNDKKGTVKAVRP